jgi:hypothetical protein
MARTFGIGMADAHDVLPRRNSGGINFLLLGRTLGATAGAGLHKTGGILHKTGKMLSGHRQGAEGRLKASV